MWCAVAAVCINAAALAGIVAASQVAAARNSSQRVMAELRRHLGAYTMILLVSPARLPGHPAPAPAPKAVRPRRAAPSRPKPLDVPDPRLLDRMDPEVARFVRDNPALEGVITREIVRDVDSRVLDATKLLAHSSIRVSFAVDDEGRVRDARIEKSSTVPSIDHLALELARLVETYGLLAAVRGLARVVISIDVGDGIEVVVEGKLRDPAGTEALRQQVRSLLVFARFALGGTDGVFMLQDVVLEAGDGRVSLRRSFAKEPLLEFLARYHGGAQK